MILIRIVIANIIMNIIMNLIMTMIFIDICVNVVLLESELFKYDYANVIQQSSHRN